MAKINEKISQNYAPILVLLLLVASFFVGRLSAQVDYLKNGVPSQAAVQPAQQQQQAAAKPNITLDTIKGLFGKDVVKLGDAKRKVLFVDISDPSCPYCHIAGGKNKKLAESDPRFKLKEDGGTYVAPVQEMKKLTEAGKASYIFIYSVGHGNGEMGAKALYCAQEKGKYWQAHDLLYSDAGYDLLNNTVKNDKAQAGKLADFLKGAVDRNFMNGCLSGGKYDARISADMKLASELGAQGTPNFFVNTSNYPGAVSFDQMQSVVDEALK